jgi:SHS2 domain-containing protein
MSPVETPTGHRALPHTADVRIEAWAPTRTACYAEAVRALVETFADTSAVLVTETAPLRIEPASDDEMLLALLEEVIFILDVLGTLPAGVVIEEALDGGLGGMLDLAPLNGVNLIGSAPKAVSRDGLAFSFDGERWTGRATIDV